MHDTHLTGTIWRTAHLTDAERRGDDTMGRLFAQFRRRTRRRRGRSG
jgi:hypothetical protein